MVKRNYKNTVRVIDLRGSESWLSDTFSSPMTCCGKHYKSVYHYMVHQKALAERNMRVAKLVEKASSFMEICKLDRSLEISPYCVWKEIEDDVHNQGVIQKFRSDSNLQEKLLALDIDSPVRVTGGRVDIPLLRSVKTILRMEEV